MLYLAGLGKYRSSNHQPSRFRSSNNYQFSRKLREEQQNVKANCVEDLLLGPKLPQMMVYVEVSVAHTLGPRHLTKHRVRSELAL